MKKSTVLPFELQCKAAGLPEPVREFAFAAPKRRWRFDFSWPAYVTNPGIKGYGGVALEVEGGVFVAGRHTRGAGFVKDLEKYNQATLLGWRVLRVTPKQIADGSALSLVEQAMKG